MGRQAGQQTPAWAVQRSLGRGLNLVLGRQDQPTQEEARGWGWGGFQGKGSHLPVGTFTSDCPARRQGICPAKNLGAFLDDSQHFSAIDTLLLEMQISSPK